MDEVVPLLAILCEVGAVFFPGDSSTVVVVVFVVVSVVISVVVLLVVLVLVVMVLVAVLVLVMMAVVLVEDVAVEVVLKVDVEVEMASRAACVKHIPPTKATHASAQFPVFFLVTLWGVEVLLRLPIKATLFAITMAFVVLLMLCVVVHVPVLVGCDEVCEALEVVVV